MSRCLFSVFFVVIFGNCGFRIQFPLSITNVFVWRRERKKKRESRLTPRTIWYFCIIIMAWYSIFHARICRHWRAQSSWVHFVLVNFAVFFFFCSLFDEVHLHTRHCIVRMHTAGRPNERLHACGVSAQHNVAAFSYIAYAIHYINSWYFHRIMTITMADEKPMERRMK